MMLVLTPPGPEIYLQEREVKNTKMYDDELRLTLYRLVRGSIQTIFKVIIQVKLDLSYPKLH